MAKEPVGNRVSRSGGQSPQNRSRESTPEPSPNTSNTETAKAPPAQPDTTAAPRATRTSRADAKYEELLAQAREIMADPEFMEEVMALVRLKMKLKADLSDGSGAALIDVLRRSVGRQKK